MRWHEISDDPNAPAVLEWKRKVLRRSRSETVDDRVSYLCRRARGKLVLDIGIVEHFADATRSEQWLHGQLQTVAKKCIGVDILEREIAELAKRGFDARLVDLTRESLNEKFDVIIMGELVEHIDAPGALLTNIRSMLESNGVLIVTTPNPWYANVMLKNVFGETVFTDSADHVAWYDASTLHELANRHGLELAKISGVRGRRATSLLGKMFFWLSPALITLGTNELIFCKTIIYEFQRLERD